MYSSKQTSTLNKIFLLATHFNSFRKTDTKETAAEFSNLAKSFENSYMSAYAGLCFLGMAKCNEADSDFESFLKAARQFKKADERKTKLGFVNNHENLEGAHRAFQQALATADDPVIKACIIRELRELNHDINITSEFNSASHRIYDLELASNENIRSGDYVGALEKLTEIVDDITERKEIASYQDVMKKNEVTRLLLLLLLELPPSRQSPSNLKLLEKYTWNHDSFDIEYASLMKSQSNQLLDENTVLLLEGLVHACQISSKDCVKEMCEEISQYKFVTVEQLQIIDKLAEKYK